MALRVLLVDDEPAFLQWAQARLGRAAGLAVVGHADSGESALALFSTLRPDLVILDVNMPGMDGFEAAHRLFEAHPETRLILVSSLDDPEYASMARAVGALTFLTKKRLSAEAVLAAVAAVQGPGTPPSG